MLSTQLQNAVIELLSQFLSNDFGNLERLKEQHDAAAQGEGGVRGSEGWGELERGGGGAQMGGEELRGEGEGLGELYYDTLSLHI